MILILNNIDKHINNFNSALEGVIVGKDKNSDNWAW
jgi:hypothetical protein